jgi:hypothetical protein
MPEVDGVIAKPFSKDVLSEKIAALLSGEGVKSRSVEKKTTKAKKTGKSISKRDKAVEDLTAKDKSPKGKALRKTKDKQ